MRNVTYTVSPGASVTDPSFGVGFWIFGFPSPAVPGPYNFGLIMFATVTQCVSNPSWQFSAIGVWYSLFRINCTTIPAGTPVLLADATCTVYVAVVFPLFVIG